MCGKTAPALNWATPNAVAAQLSQDKLTWHLVNGQTHGPCLLNAIRSLLIGHRNHEQSPQAGSTAADLS
jgi:hypothetical protein